MQFYSSSDLVLLVLEGFLEEGEQKGVAGASPHDLADDLDVAKEFEHHQSLVEDDLYMSMQSLPFFRKGISSLLTLSLPSTSAMKRMLLAAPTRFSTDSSVRSFISMDASCTYCFDFFPFIQQLIINQITTIIPTSLLISML